MALYFDAVLLGGVDDGIGAREIETAFAALLRIVVLLSGTLFSTLTPGSTWSPIHPIAESPTLIL